MTRETKIGLLVGLAFIIVVGILLSDHMTSTNEPASAPLQLAGTNVRSGLGQFSSEDAAPVTITPPNVAPQQPVPTADELAPKPHPALSQAPAQNMPNSLPLALRTTATNNGEELVDGGGQPLPIVDTGARPGSAKSPITAYKVQAGDSLSKIALKALGANTRANRDAIIAANPALREDPDKLIVGKTYVIPSAAGAASSPVTLTSRKPTADPQYTYTVKPGDTLWSIAVNELGNANTIPAIKELNKDVLGDANRIHPNMRLRLPAKPIASANG